MDCFIDSATLYEIIGITRNQNLNESTKWSFNSSIFTTSALINLTTMKTAPAPSSSHAATDIYGFVSKSIADMIGNISLDPHIGQKALDSTKTLVQQNTSQIQNALHQVKSDESYSQWLRTGKQHSWIEHSSRLDGLFNLELIPQISAILDIPVKILAKEWRNSCNIDFIKQLARDKVSNEQQSIIEDAYTTSALLRGYYHDQYAKLVNHQIIHHPFRKPILPKLEAQKESFGSTNVETYLSIIILAGAIAQSNHKERVITWIDNVRKARVGIPSNNFSMENQSSKSIAVQTAADIAKKLDIHTSPKWIDHVINVLIGLNAGCISTFVLQGWPGLVLGTGTSIAMESFDIGGSINTRISNREHRLISIVNRYAGRIEQEWTVLPE